MTQKSLTLPGNFVNLRQLKVEDAELTFQWRHSKRAQFLNTAPASVDQQISWISQRPNSEYNFIIELSDGHPIGTLSLVNVDLINRHAESARFLIGDEEASAGRPAAVEAMKLLYDFAFNDIGLARIYGGVIISNVLMIKWQKYLGMKEEGRLRSHLYRNGRFYDVICFGILIDEYKQTTLPRMRTLIELAVK